MCRVTVTALRLTILLQTSREKMCNSLYLFTL
jgi:hypothetical protein